MTSRGDLLRWGLAFALVLLVHGALAAALLRHAPPPPEGLPSDAVTIDMDADPSQVSRPEDVSGPEVTDALDPPPEPEEASEAEPPAPDSPPPELAEAKPPVETAPPELTAPPAPAAQAEAVLPPTPEEPPKSPEKPPEEVAEAKPEPKPPEERPPEARQERLTAPSQARAASAQVAGGGGRPSPAAIATWGAKLGAHLAQHKSPAAARARGQQGVATLRITLDGAGRVLSRQLVKSSGSALLDQESLNLVLRAQPLPKPPPNMTLPVTLTIPVRFSVVR